MRSLVSRPWLVTVAAAAFTPSCALDYDGLATGEGGQSGTSSSASASASSSSGAAPSSSSSSSVASSSSSAQTTGSAGGADEGGGGAGGGTGGGGGGADPCGNGIIDDGERCDGGEEGAEGCTPDCELDCDGDGEVLEDTSGHCYYIQPSDDDRDWDESRELCETDFGGHLVIVETSDEFDWLANELAGDPDATRYWVGADDLATNKTFLWLDGSTVPLDQAYWRDGEPNDNGDCVLYEVNSDATRRGLDDKNCDDTERPLCERSPPGISRR